jgi:predicted transposase YbfD/YdcC
MPTIASSADTTQFEFKVGEAEIKFIDVLNALPDKRDNRGKRHSLTFLVATVVFAILVGRSKVSSIHRYMINKIDWLREVTGFKDAKPISRAHLPRMLANLDWGSLTHAIHQCFDERTAHLIQHEWISIDGKVMRGTLKSGEKQALIHAVAHDSRIDVAQACQAGDKASEITVLRELIKESGLEAHKISMDAHHCNPETLGQINRAEGLYLVQVKENQPKLFERCRLLSEQSARAETLEHDLSHGRINTRHACLYDVTPSDIDSRWKNSGLQTVIVMNRETIEKSSQKTTCETAYYVSNYRVENRQYVVEMLAHVVRRHWGVESNNWQLDVTFGEDRVQVKNGNQAQIMGKLRCLAMNLLRWSKMGEHNFQASIEKFMDSPEALFSMLKQVNFL